MLTVTGGMRGRRRVVITWAFGGGALLAIAAVVVVAVASGSGPYRAIGIGTPGALVRIGTPVLRLVVDFTATLCVGWLAFAVCFTRPQDSGTVSPRGYDALRRAGRWAVAWLVSVLVLVPFDTASIAGQPLAEVLRPAALIGLAGALEGPTAWLLTAGVVLLVVVGARATLRWRPTVGLLVLAVFAVLPPLCTAHSSSDAGHDLATAAILVHVPVALIWLGVLAAILLYARRDRGVRTAVVSRYARLAGGCWLVLAISGAVDAAVLVPVGKLFTTSYGLVLFGKIVLVAGIGLVGLLFRRKVLRGAAGGSVRGAAVIRMAVAELVVLAATFAASVGLTHLPPPAFVGQAVSVDQTLLGYDLSGPPTLARLALDWRFEVVFGSLAIVLAIAYLLGVRRVTRAGGHWPAARTAVWLVGCGVLLVATSSGVGRYASAMFSVHMTSHMLVGMLAPMLFALGGPLTLLRAAVAPAGPGALYGPREWVEALVDSRLMSVLTHPLVALGVFALAPFVLYFTSLFDGAARFHWAHMAITAVFGIIGYLFAWPAIGVDPTRRPMPTLARLGMLLAAMPADLVFGALVMTTHRVIGNGPAGGNMYSALALPWVPSLLADQRVAGGIALVVGEVSLLVALVALLVRWSRIDAGEVAGTADPEAALLAALARRDRAAR